MRARSLKPGFFKNEVLGSADPLYGLLFEGLWCAADREGRLEDRPLRICAEVFPYRRAIKARRMDVMLQWLHDRKFITRYEVDGEQFIQVLEFKKHQTPHVKEGPSKIPELRQGKPRARNVPSTGPAPDETQPFPQPVRSDSGLRTPDSGLSDSGLRAPHMGAHPSTGPAPDSGPRDDDALDPVAQRERFERVKSAYPKFAGRQNWIQAQHYCHLRIDEGATWKDLLAGVERYAKHIRAIGKEGTQHVLRPENFFNAPDRPWAQEWTLPESAKPSKPNGATAPRLLSAGEIIERAILDGRTDDEIIAMPELEEWPTVRRDIREKREEIAQHAGH